MKKIKPHITKKNLRSAVLNQFLKLRLESVGKFGPNRFLQYEKCILPDDRYGIFTCMAADYTRGLIGAVNRFFYDIYQADCWIQATISLNREMRMPILYEFAEPLLELSVGRPYSLRNQLVFAATHLLHQANQSRQPNWRDDLPPDNRITFEVLCARGRGWAGFESFKRCLNALNNEAFVKRTQNFRHTMQHRFRLHFHLGLTLYWKRVEKNESVVYEYTQIPPLQLDTLIHSLVDQHTVALDAFEAYWELIDEILSEWPKKCAKQSTETR